MNAVFQELWFTGRRGKLVPWILSLLLNMET